VPPAPAGQFPLPPGQEPVQIQEPPKPVEPPAPTYEDLVIPRDSVLGLQTDNRVSSDTAHVEDRVDAHVTRDVRVGDRVAIPAGAKVIGTVAQVERGGKFKEQAKLGIRFHTIVLADGTRVPISTETIVRLGEAPGNGTAAKIGGGAVGGAILGAILGGAKGAAIGATAGAGAGTAATGMGDRSTVVLAPGTPLTPRIVAPATVTIEKDRER
jgi:type IV secretory pathway VirB10-like protein